MSRPLGDLIRRKRKSKGWTQTRLAEELSLQQVTVSEWETGRNYPRDIRQVADALGITHQELQMAFHAVFEQDDVVIALSAAEAISRDAREALLALYYEARQAFELRRQTDTDSEE